MFAAPFPLTPALSLGERENRIPSHRQTRRWICRTAIEITEASQLLSRLPEGEGQGEGERSEITHPHRRIQRRRYSSTPLSCIAWLSLP